MAELVEQDRNPVPPGITDSRCLSCSDDHGREPRHSWLDQAELFFSILTRRLLRRGEFTSQQDPMPFRQGFCRGQCGELTSIAGTGTVAGCDVIDGGGTGCGVG